MEHRLDQRRKPCGSKLTETQVLKRRKLVGTGRQSAWQAGHQLEPVTYHKACPLCILCCHLLGLDGRSVLPPKC